MKRLIVLMVAVLVLVLATIGVVIVVNNNNNNNMVAKTAPTQVTATTAPKATATAVPTVMPMPKSTTMPAIATAMPTNVPTAAPTTAMTTLTSLEASEKTILVDSLGYRHAMILEGDLKKVTYKEIKVDVENGICLRLNGLGVIGEIWHRESMVQEAKTVNNSHDESYVRKFFSQNGELFTNYVREGYAGLKTSTRLYQITGIRFVQLQGEDFFRLVVKGTGNSGNGNGGNDYPVVTPAPTTNFPDDPIKPEPSHNPETTTPAATATPAPTATPNYATGDLPDFPEDEITTCPSHNPFEVEEVATPTPTPHYAEGDLPDFPD